jgi:hypothetical protein
VGVINQTDNRPLPGRLDQQTVNSQTQRRRVWRARGTNAERRPQSLSLGTGQPFSAIQLPAKLVNGRVRKALFGFHAKHSNDAEIRCRLDGLVQQCRLPDTCFSLHDEGATVAGTDLLEKLIQFLAFPLEPHCPVRPDYRRVRSNGR